jgi:acetate kinase
MDRCARVKATTGAIAILLVLDAICQPHMPVVHAVGYRVVHPGAKLNRHQLITAEVLRDLQEAQAFAPFA